MEEYPKIILDGNLELLKRSVEMATQTGTGLETVYWNIFYILDIISKEVTPAEKDKKLVKCSVAIDNCVKMLGRALQGKS